MIAGRPQQAVPSDGDDRQLPSGAFFISVRVAVVGKSVKCLHIRTRNAFVCVYI